MGAVVAPAPPTIALNSTTSASSSSSQFGHLVSPPLHQLHPQLASNSILNNVAAPSKPSNGVGPQLSYLQIAGSLMTSSANSSSRSAVYSSNQATSSTPLVHPSSSSSPFAFVPKPVGKDHDSFKDAFEQARDKLHLFERRFGGDDGRETTTTAATAAQDGAGTPTKGEAKRKRGEGGSDSEKKRTEKKSKKGDEGGADEQQKKKKKKKKDKKSSSGKSKPKKEDGSASLALDEKPEGGFTFMQGAYFILKREHRFMTAKEIVAIGVAEDLFASSKGKTPEATVAAGIYVDLKKPISQFCQGCKVGKRGFGLSEWKDLESIPGPPDTPVKTRRRTTKSEEGAKKKQTSAASPSTSSRRTAKKREEEEEARRRRQALLEEEDAEEEEEEIEEEMVIVEEEEDEDEASGGDSTSTPPPTRSDRSPSARRWHFKVVAA